MRVVLDTNVLISALFFAGLPGRILAAWVDERFGMLASVEILVEYRRVVARLQGRFPSVEAQPLLDRVIRNCHLVEPTVVPRPSVPFSRDSKLSRMRALCFTGREKPKILTHLATPSAGSPEMQCALGVTSQGLRLAWYLAALEGSAAYRAALLTPLRGNSSPWRVSVEVCRYQHSGVIAASTVLRNRSPAPAGSPRLGGAPCVDHPGQTYCGYGGQS